MNNINIKKFLTILTAAFSLFVFAGCSGIDGDKTNKSTKQILLTGSIVTAGARSATTSFDIPQGANYRMEARQGEKQTDITINDNLSFDTVLPCAGNWTVYLYIVGAGCVDCYHTTTEINVPEDVDSFQMGNIVINPTYDGVGDIYLKFKTESNLIKYLRYSAILCYRTGFENSLKNGGTVNFENKTATLYLPDVHANPYEVTFEFCDENGHVLYSCRENVTVFAGFHTDTWVGNGAHLVEAKVDEGATEFCVTQKLISDYGADLVPNSQYLLYSTSSGATDYYFADYADEEIIAGETIPLTGDSRNNSFAFDKDGNICISLIRESGKNKKVQMNGRVYEFDDDEIDMNCNAILIDRKTNYFYIVYCMQADFKLFQFPNFIDGTDETRMESKTTIPISFPYPAFDSTDYHDMDIFAIYDNIIYGIKKVQMSYDVIFYTIDLNEPYPKAERIYLDADAFKDFGIDRETLYNCSISDILYQEGNIYFLLNDVNLSDYSNNTFHSRGAVCCYNLFTKKISNVIGWANTPLSNDHYAYLAYEKSTYKTELLQYTSDDITYYPLIKASDWKHMMDGNQMFYIYGLEESDDGFYGPRKFIALEPKKLVIADDGVAFYTDANDAYRAKNTNRVVTVDLESFTMDSTDASSSIEFDEKVTRESGLLEGNCCSYESVKSSVTPVYDSRDHVSQPHSFFTGDENKVMFSTVETGDNTTTVGATPVVPLDN